MMTSKNNRIQALTSDLEFWIAKKLTAKDRLQERHTLELSENLDFINQLRDRPQPSAEICAALRANALKASRYSAIIAAHYDLLADQLDPRGQSIH